MIITMLQTYTGDDELRKRKLSYLGRDIRHNDRIFQSNAHKNETFVLN